MILRTLALVSLGTWAVATVLYGAGDLVNQIQNVHSFRAAMSSTESSGHYENAMFGLSLLSGTGFLLGTLAGGVGAVLGAIQIGLAGRGATRVAGFSVLSLGGVGGAAALSQVRNTSDALAIDYINWTVLGALTFPLIALVVFLNSWLSVQAPRDPARSVKPVR